MNVAHNGILRAFWNESLPILQSTGKIHLVTDSIADYSPPVEMFYPALLVALLLYPWLLRNLAAPVIIPQPPIQIYQLHAASVLGAALLCSFAGPLLPGRTHTRY